MSASRRSARVSPMPIRMPEVKGTPASPAAAMEASRAEGSLSGQSACGPPGAARRAEVDSSMSPCETETCRAQQRRRNAWDVSRGPTGEMEAPWGEIYGNPTRLP